MQSRHSKFAALFLALVSCLLLCSIFCAETPELLNLTDNTCNDFMLRKSASPDGLHALNERSLAVIQFMALNAVTHNPPEQWVPAKESSSPTRSQLLILHSVLRR